MATTACMEVNFDAGFGATNPDSIDINLREGGQLAQPRLHVQLAQPRLPEDHQELPERDGRVVVLIHLLDHGFKTKMCLRSSKFFHHDLKLLKTDCSTARHIVQCELGLKVFDLFSRKFCELCEDRHLCISLFHLSTVVKSVIDLISAIEDR